MIPSAAGYLLQEHLRRQLGTWLVQGHSNPSDHDQLTDRPLVSGFQEVGQGATGHSMNHQAGASQASRQGNERTVSAYADHQWIPR